jgi:hypothetical protein
MKKMRYQWKLLNFLINNSYNNHLILILKKNHLEVLAFNLVMVTEKKEILMYGMVDLAEKLKGILIVKFLVL